MGAIKVADIIKVMEQLAPPILAEEWDNCGLQVGSAQWEVHKIRVALDPLMPVVQAAILENVDVLITHHPLMIHPLRAVDVDTPAGKIIEMALSARLALYAAHTNLDSAREGVNDTLARIIGLKSLVPMVPSHGAPAEARGKAAVGMGRLGRLQRPLTLGQLARRVKEQLGLPAIKVTGSPDLRIHQVAVCSGSGSSLLDVFLQGPAQVYISGDLRYHDARKAEDAGRALIDVGHFSSEHLVIDPLVSRLKAAVRSHRWRVEIEACRLERDPFSYWMEGEA